MHSKTVLAVANWVAAAGAFVIRLFGGEAKVSGNILRTASGGFIVTQECIMTPLIPAYFAAVFALSLTWRQRAASLLLAFPVFFVLGAARLLVLAFPTRVVGSHLVAIHGFYQFLLAAFLVGMTATLTARHPRSVRALLKPVSAALVAGGLTAYLVGLTYSRLLFWLVDRLQAGLLPSGHSYQDPQGALLIMVPYQLGLFVGLWVAWRGQVPWRRGLIGLAALLMSQPLVIVLVREWVTHTPIEAHVAVIRAWSMISVLLVGAWIVKRLRSTAPRPSLSATEAQHG